MEKIRKADQEEDLKNLEEKKLKEEQEMKKEKFKNKNKIKDKEKLEIDKKPFEQDITTDKEKVYKNQAIFNLVEKTSRDYLAKVNTEKEVEEYKKVNSYYTDKL